MSVCVAVGFMEAVRNILDGKYYSLCSTFYVTLLSYLVDPYNNNNIKWDNETFDEGIENQQKKIYMNSDKTFFLANLLINVKYKLEVIAGSLQLPPQNFLTQNIFLKTVKDREKQTIIKVMSNKYSPDCIKFAYVKLQNICDKKRAIWLDTFGFWLPLTDVFLISFSSFSLSLSPSPLFS